MGWWDGTRPSCEPASWPHDGRPAGAASVRGRLAEPARQDWPVSEVNCATAPVPDARAGPLAHHESVDRVRRTIRRHGLAGPGTRVVAAVSGGSDSVALAHFLRELDAPASCASSASRTSTISCGRRRTTTSVSARSSAARSVCRCSPRARRRAPRWRGASAAPSRMPARTARHAFFERARIACRRRRGRARPHARRSGRNLPAPPAARRRRARARVDASAATARSSARCSTAAGTSWPRTSSARRCAFVDDELERRCQHPAQPRARRAAAASRRSGSTRRSSTCWPTKPSLRATNGVDGRGCRALLERRAGRSGEDASVD